MNIKKHSGPCSCNITQVGSVGEAAEAVQSMRTALGVALGVPGLGNIPKQRNHCTNEKGLNKDGKIPPPEHYVRLCLLSGMPESGATSVSRSAQGVSRVQVNDEGPGLPSADPPLSTWLRSLKAQEPCQAQANTV